MIRSETNIGQNGYARAFRETDSPYLIELDDDVVDAPAGWDAMLRDAFVTPARCRLPGRRPRGRPATTRHRASATRSALTSTRWSRRTACGLLTRPGRRRLRDDLARAERARRGVPREQEGGLLARGRRLHRGHPESSASAPRCWPTCAYTTRAARTTRRSRRRRRSTGSGTGHARRVGPRVKRVLVRVPFVRRLNARFGWFVAPS